MRPLSLSQRSSLESVVQTCVRNLPSSPAAEYLKGRGFDRATADRHRLGYMQDAHPGFETGHGRLVIPNICAAGHVVGVKFRALDDETEPKYTGPPMPSRLFNLAALNTPSTLIVLTEGELDAVSLTQLGLPAVGIPGAKAWKPHHYRVFESYERVVLVQDDDQAGNDLAKKLLSTDLPVTVVRPAGVKDVNAALIAGLGDQLVAAIKGVDA